MDLSWADSGSEEAYTPPLPDESRVHIFNDFRMGLYSSTTDLDFLDFSKFPDIDDLFPLDDKTDGRYHEPTDDVYTGVDPELDAIEDVAEDLSSASFDFRSLALSTEPVDILDNLVVPELTVPEHLVAPEELPALPHLSFTPIGDATVISQILIPPWVASDLQALYGQGSGLHDGGMDHSCLPQLHNPSQPHQERQPLSYFGSPSTSPAITPRSGDCSSPDQYAIPVSEAGLHPVMTDAPRHSPPTTRRQSPTANVCPICFHTTESSAPRDIHRHIWTTHRQYAIDNKIPNEVRRCPEPLCGRVGRKDNIKRHYESKHGGSLTWRGGMAVIERF